MQSAWDVMWTTPMPEMGLGVRTERLSLKPVSRLEREDALLSFCTGLPPLCGAARGTISGEFLAMISYDEETLVFFGRLRRREVSCILHSKGR